MVENVVGKKNSDYKSVFPLHVLVDFYYVKEIFCRMKIGKHILAKIASLITKEC